MIRSSVEGRIGRITLDRPRALNALSLGMIQGMRRCLADFELDDGVAAVAVDSASERAFCAGGDVREAQRMASEGRWDDVVSFFAQEYGLDLAVGRHPKACVAIIDGIAMGGGLGISVNGRYRVVTEHAVLAMPETSIGFFPDVGASHFLPKLPGFFGTYLGLTGARVTGADAVCVGLATHFVPRQRLPALWDALRDGDVPAAPEPHRDAAEPSPALTARVRLVDRCFGASSLRGIFEALRDEGSEEAREVETMLRAVSPSALQAAFGLLRGSGGRTLEECLARELELARKMLRSHDFIEGVRAMLVDKDRDPQWRPATVEELEGW